MATGNRSLVMTLTLIATLGGLLFGYDTAVISGAISSIDANFINPRHLDEAARNSLSGFTISSALWGCVLGGLIAGWVGDRLGRRAGLMPAAGMVLIWSIGAGPPRRGLRAVAGRGRGATLRFHAY